MKLEANSVTRAIRARQKQLGLWVSLSNNFAAEVVASAGFDWALVDMEHSPNDLFSVLGQLQAFAASSTGVIVRPQWNDPVLVKRLLDIGVPGLLFPMIQSDEEARNAVASTRYPPRGIRGVTGSSRANKFGRVTDYFDRVERNTTVIMQVETIAALERAQAIGAVEGVDGIFFGPADIAADMGLLGQPMHDDVWEKIMIAAEKLIAADVPVGTLVLNPGFAADLLNRGFTFVAGGSDTALLAQAADSTLSQMKEALR